MKKLNTSKLEKYQKNEIKKELKEIKGGIIIEDLNVREVKVTRGQGKKKTTGCSFTSGGFFIE